MIHKYTNDFSTIFQQTTKIKTSGDKVEDAFLDTARKIYQNIQDGRLDLNASESGVQHKTTQPGRTSLTDTPASKENCSC